MDSREKVRFAFKMLTESFALFLLVTFEDSYSSWIQWLNIQFRRLLASWEQSWSRRVFDVIDHDDGGADDYKTDDDEYDDGDIDDGKDKGGDESGCVNSSSAVPFFVWS